MGKFALVIGIGNYGDQLTALPAAPKDAAAMADVLQHPDRGNFTVETLVDPDRETLATALEEWLMARQPDNTALIFFSGHGLKDDRRELYFAARNTRKNKNRLITSTALAAHSLLIWLTQCRAKRQVLILDCCFSGAFGDLLARDDAQLDLQEQLIAQAEGRIVLTSTSSVDYAFEQKGADLSIYSRYLVEGIRTGAADLDKDGHISVDELHRYAKGKVQEAAPAMAPQLISLKQGEGYRIIVARAPQDDPKLKYRQEFEQKAQQHQGHLPIFAQRVLNGRANELGLSPTDQATIEQEVLQPYRDYAQKLLDYERDLADQLAQGYPFSPAVEAALEEYERYLKLRDTDIAAIRQRLLGPKQAEYERQQRETERQRQEAEQQRQAAAQAAYQANLQRYAQGFQQLINQAYPLSPAVEAQLKTAQQQMGLKPEDVQQLEQPLRDQAEARHQEHLRQAEAERLAQQQALERQREQERQRAEAAQKQQAVQPPAPPKAKGWVTRPVEIETVTLKVEKAGLFGGQSKLVTTSRRCQVEVYSETLAAGVTLDMVKIPAGEFLMGTANQDRDQVIQEYTRYGLKQADAEKYVSWEMPQHRVTVPEFFMAKTPITQAQYQAIMGENPSQFKENGANRPVECVSWHQAVEFCQKLSQKTGKNYRLPSEAEWEYSCRAGTTTPFYFGSTITPDLVNYNSEYPYGNAPKRKYRGGTSEVGSFPSNAFGLYDMHGNVWEWCADSWHNDYNNAPNDGSVWTVNGDDSRRVLRGGSWNYIAWVCRSAFRDWGLPDGRVIDVGFRVVVGSLVVRTP